MGRQEDAHEFLIYFLSAMENSAKNYAISMNKKYTKLSQNTNNNDFEDNLIQKIFGGRLISSVVCGKCKKSSDKLDKYTNISLVFFIF